jgi:hypothetical protein
MQVMFVVSVSTRENLRTVADGVPLALGTSAQTLRLQAVGCIYACAKAPITGRIVLRDEHDTCSSVRPHRLYVGKVMSSK